MDWTDHTTRHSFEGAARNYNFYGGLIWIFCHKSFPKDPPIETGFRVHFRKGDIDDLEKKCLAEIVLVLPEVDTEAQKEV